MVFLRGDSLSLGEGSHRLVSVKNASHFDLLVGIGKVEVVKRVEI